MGSREKNASDSDEIIESDEKSASTIATPLPILQPIPEPNSDLSPVVSTRSRRPSLAKPDLLSSQEGQWKSTDSAMEPAKKEKWTAKRVIKVTWAYVSTVKVFSKHSSG